MTSAALTPVLRRAQHDAHRLRWASRILAAVLIAIGIILAFYLQNAHTLDSIHRAQVDSCRRGNVVRLEISENVLATEQVLRELVRIEGDGFQADSLLKKLTPIPPVNCEEAIPSP